MGKESEPRKPHAYIIPFPAQGHMNPSLAFAKCLASKGLSVTVITTTKMTKSAKFSRCSSIAITSISDGSEDIKESESIEAYFKRFRAALSHNLEKFIDEQKRQGCCAKAIIYDSVMPWILDIAHGRGLLGASFFTMSCAASAIFCHIQQGSLRFPFEESMVSLPSLPAFETKDLPSFTHRADPTNRVARLLVDQFLNLDQADWIFFNTFDKLEYEVVKWMARRWPIKTVGPTCLLVQKDETVDKNHTINLFEPNDEDCIQWLDSREAGSVVYVSFGSLASLGKEQMEELAFGLIMSNCNFLWVVRSTEAEKLPQDFSLLSSEKGLVVEWCHQPQVLAHRALACFMTHCGWNSTLEGLSHGVPLLPMAQFVDQKTNAKFIADVWGVGVGVEPGEDGIVGREEIAKCIREAVHGDRGIEIRRNACRWKELANEAVEKGGTSAENIEDFVAKLM